MVLHKNFLRKIKFRVQHHGRTW